MRVRFTEPYDYTPSADRRVTYAYAAGAEETVKRECGDAAVKAGKAVEIDAPPRQDDAPAAKVTRARRR